MPEPIPLGLTLLFAIVLAIVWASFVNKSLGGSVETVFTLRTHFCVLAIAFFLLIGRAPTAATENTLFIRDALGCVPLCEQRPNVL